MSDETEKQAEDPAEEIESEVTETAPAAEVEATEEDSPVAEEVTADLEESGAPAAEAEDEAAPSAEEVSTTEAGDSPEAETPAAEEAAAPSDDKAEVAASADVPVAEASSDEEKSDLLRQAEERLGVMEQAESGPELIEKVVHINRCAKVVKGGRRFSFSALVVCGDQQGRVGYGFGKANGVAECIQKASESSKQSMVKVNITGSTIPHEVIGEFGGGRVLLRPASPGTGIIAGGGVRSVIESAGIKDVLAKSMGSNNHFNVVKATLDALQQLRTREQIYALRGKKTRDQASI